MDFACLPANNLNLKKTHSSLKRKRNDIDDDNLNTRKPPQNDAHPGTEVEEAAVQALDVRICPRPPFILD
jgi:hypothetical protein